MITSLKNISSLLPENAMYRSKTTQNELISCCSEILNESFSLFLPTKLQTVPIKNRCLLFFDMLIRKVRFIKYIHCDTGITGEALKEKILNVIQNELNLDIQYCRVQCYDGEGNTAAKYSGVAARIIKLNYLALYTHCASHRLNICVGASCQNQNVKNMMDNIQVIFKFFSNSPKKQLLFDQMVAKFLPQYKPS